MTVTYDAIRADRTLRQWTQAAVDPGLTTEEIDDLLWSARVTDAALVGVDDPTWTPTYGHAQLRAAASEGWRLKAGKLTNDFDAAVGAGTDFKRKQKWDMCMQIAQEFASTSGGAGTGSGSGSLMSVPITTENWLVPG